MCLEVLKAFWNLFHKFEPLITCELFKDLSKIHKYFTEGVSSFVFNVFLVSIDVGF